MTTNSSSKFSYVKRTVNPTSDEFHELVSTADAFIFAAGFEARAKRVPMVLGKVRKSIILAYKSGPSENDTSFDKAYLKFSKEGECEVCELDLAHAEKFELAFEHSIKTISNLSAGRLIMDISGMPNFAICIAIAKIRQVFPAVKLILVYTEADEYFPTENDYEKLRKKSIKHSLDLFPDFLSTKAVSMFMPSIFSGVTLGQNDTCLMIFTGYEPHRSNCAIEALNPSKLVLIYSEPERDDLKWRKDLSRLMHLGIADQLKMTEEMSSTSEVDDNLDLILKYYDYLYDDHAISVCPINSKVQAVAATIAWETYPDIQLNFPIPAQYLAKQFSNSWRATFLIDLSCSLGARRFMPNF